ncbi:MAG: hypothetical protein GXX91_13860 [Verrucomicrobiaceae bacterium]|nr:hypothetical protein [Verrucomicrobiaceae bacterium]
MTPRAHEANAVAAIKHVLHACRAYAADHDDGAYPPNLATLVPDYLDEATALFVDDGSGEKLPLLYFPGFHTDSDPGAILIECPVQYTKNRIVGEVGGHVEALVAE